MELTPPVLVRAYCSGIFPMGDPGGTIRWYAPDPRGILPLHAFHVPHNTARLVRQERFAVTANRAFDAVIDGCAAREQTWITPAIRRAYCALHRAGAAHSVECWTEGGTLAGGLYGVALGGAFFGESMFYRESGASKVALVHLVRRMNARGFRLLDTQFTTPHLERFGAVEIPRADYRRRLADALAAEVSWVGDVQRGAASSVFSSSE